MIGSVLSYLRDRLDEHLRASFPNGADPASDKVVFVDGDKMEPLVFKPEAVSILLINLEEERQTRAPNPYQRIDDEGMPHRVRPDIPLMLSVLFVARFKQYDAAWDHLTAVLSFFQKNAAIEAGSPGLPDAVDKLVFDLITLKFGEQNEVWNALRATHHPSLLYRVKLVVLRDAEPALSNRVVLPIVINSKQLSR